jgi:hypothetical protein
MSPGTTSIEAVT